MVGSGLKILFPKLSDSVSAVTSPKTDEYNCIAWAAGITDEWWWPDPLGEEYWPLQAPRTATIEAFIQAYQTIGYVVCADASLEPDKEKIALYADVDGSPTHAARQLPDGQWSSKLGASEDISHAELESLAGDIYGSATQIMARPRQT